MLQYLVNHYSSISKKVYLIIIIGMQVIGKTSKVKVPVDGKISKFPVIKNLFDFQITN